MHPYVDETNREFCAAIAAGDAAAAAAVYTPQAWLLPPGSDLLRGTGAITKFWAAGIGAGIRHADLHTLTVDRHDGLAIEVGRYTLRIEPPGGDPVTDAGKYVVIHRQAGGVRRWDLDIFNSDQPAG